MIRIGLTSWSEHVELLHKKKLTLKEYATRLPLVEVDTPFYGIPKQDTVDSWVQDTPKPFKFLIKAHQTMTLQKDWQTCFSNEESMFSHYLEAMEPMIQSGKLLAFLFQFPAYFACNQTHVAYLKKIRTRFSSLPIALEFRSGTWYDEAYRKSMVRFMKNHQFTLVTVDEPAVPTNRVPFLPLLTTPDLAIFRLHGKNLTGWLDKGPDWRKKRTLYRYSTEELANLGKTVQSLAKKSKDVAVIFNNNSGGDAAANAKELQSLLQINYTNLHPQQLDLFGEE